MSTRYVRMSFLAVFTLSLVVALSACSKKDVMSDEPVITPSEMADTGGTASGAEFAGQTGSAGDSGAAVATGDEMKTAYFAYDSFSLGSEARAALKDNAAWLKANPNSTLQVEGHCDERGTTEYNLALGEKRANAARDYLVRSGIAPSRVSVISYGEERPADPGHDEGAWSRNRRAEFVIVSR